MFLTPPSWLETILMISIVTLEGIVPELKKSSFISLLFSFHRYMDSPDDDGGGANNHLIKMKTCPRCSTPIRKSLRYGNVIKQRLEDIAKVKIAARGNPQEISGTQGRLLARLTELRRFGVKDDLAKDLERLERSINRLAKGTMAAVTENQVTLMERYCAMNERINQHLCDLQKVALKWHNKQHLNLKGAYYFFSRYVNIPTSIPADSHHC